jgi:glycine/D-amino acid oxidase-like deaminating enzyme
LEGKTVTETASRTQKTWVRKRAKVSFTGLAFSFFWALKNTLLLLAHNLGVDSSPEDHSTGMDLKSGKLFWPWSSPASCLLPPLDRDCSCHTAIIGSGLTGALIARKLCRDGVDVVLLDKRGIGTGSTSASTALIQYEIDLPLWRLIQRRGQAEAVRCYQLCRQAIQEIARTVSELDHDCEFHRRPSLYFVRHANELAGLRREFRTRLQWGFPVEFLTQREVAQRFSFSAPGAIWSSEAAEINPYRFTQLLALDALSHGLRAYAPVTVRRFSSERAGVVLQTDTGHRIVARSLIVAAGYESVQFLRPELIRLRSTYALTTQPVSPLTGWEERCLMWDSGRPYHYLRTTRDQRLMIGGGDEDFVSPKKRDALIPKKGTALLKTLQEMFPRLNLRSEFTWAGTFGDTADGLPYIGTREDDSRIMFALCFGANGTNFAALAALMAREWVHGREHSDASLFRLDR